MTDLIELPAYWEKRLRPYQKQAIRDMRTALRAGHRNILIVAPTGSGKTEIAACLVDMNQKKGKRCAFVVDRKSLIRQSSETFDFHRIEHGVIQADHPRFRPSLQTQVCSVQTIGRRRWPEADLVIVDEAHTVNKVVAQRIGPRTAPALGLTATPFTKGLGKLYDCIVNVTTTTVARLCGRDVKTVQHWANGGDPKDTDARVVLQLYARFCPAQYHEHEKQFKITVEEQWAESQS